METVTALENIICELTSWQVEGYPTILLTVLL